MVILGFAVGLAVEPEVTGDLAVAVGPEQRDQVDPADGLVVLARPMARDQSDVLGVGLGERGVVQHQGTAGSLHGGLGLGPLGVGVGLQPVEESVEGVVRRGEVGLGLHARGLRTTDPPLGSNQELDVRLIGTAWCVHNRILRSVNALTN